jgi:hypothetical protein
MRPVMWHGSRVPQTLDALNTIRIAIDSRVCQLAGDGERADYLLTLEIDSEILSALAVEGVEQSSGGLKQKCIRGLSIGSTSARNL